MIDPVTLQIMVETAPDEIARIEEELVYLNDKVKRARFEAEMFASKERNKELLLNPRATITALNDRIIESCRESQYAVFDKELELDLKKKEFNHAVNKNMNAKQLLTFKGIELRNIGGVL